jgi:hypothetical protein
MAQSIVKRGSVVLIRYPFTDLTGAKVRPRARGDTQPSALSS